MLIETGALDPSLMEQLDFELAKIPADERGDVRRATVAVGYQSLSPQERARRDRLARIKAAFTSPAALIVGVGALAYFGYRAFQGR